jgi:hypothetical protein
VACFAPNKPANTTTAATSVETASSGGRSSSRGGTGGTGSGSATTGGVASSSETTVTASTSGSSGGSTGGGSNRVVLVDNDGAPGTDAIDFSLPVFEGLLAGAGLSQDLISLRGDGSQTSGPGAAPTFAQLQQYDLVVWFTGDNAGTGPVPLVSPSQKAALTEWLDQGGKTLLLFSEYLVDRGVGDTSASWTVPPTDPLLQVYLGVEGGVGDPDYRAPYDLNFYVPMDSMVYYLVYGTGAVSASFGTEKWEIAPRSGFTLNVDIVNPGSGIDTLASTPSAPTALANFEAAVAIGNRGAGATASSTAVYVGLPLECVSSDLGGVGSAQLFFDGLLDYAGIAPGGGSSSGASSGGTAASTSGGTTSAGGSSGMVGATASTGGTTGAMPYYGVLERGGGPMRNAVFQDPAFTHTNLAQLRTDPSFVSPIWTGPVLSQPLYFIDAATSQTALIVTTESNEIYAISPTTGSVVWSVSTLVPPIDAATYMVAPGTIPTIGITGTPVIDPVARVMYLAAGTVVASEPHWQMFAIDLDDGSTIAGWPADLDGLPMTLANGTNATFTSNSQVQRGSLVLLDGVVYAPFGGTGNDFGTYHGVVIAVPTANPSAASAWATSAYSGAGIWGPSGVASDGTSLFVATGNGNADGLTRPTLWNNSNSDAVLRLIPGSLLTFSGAATDYFAPSDPAQDWYTDDEDDLDLGSSGVVLFDASASSPSQLAFAIGKTNNAYLLDRANLGGISTGLSELPGVSTPYQVFGSMAAYTTAATTYVVANSAGNGVCTGATSAFAVGGSPPALVGGWCSPLGGKGSPIVTTSDGINDYALWTLGLGLTPLDGDTGQPFGSEHSVGAYEHWVTPIVAQGAIYIAGSTRAYKFSFP